jgi:hypothetical protein
LGRRSSKAKRSSAPAFEQIMLSYSALKTSAVGAACAGSAGRATAVGPVAIGEAEEEAEADEELVETLLARAASVDRASASRSTGVPPSATARPDTPFHSDPRRLIGDASTFEPTAYGRDRMDSTFIKQTNSISCPTSLHMYFTKRTKPRCTVHSPP